MKLLPFSKLNDHELCDEITPMYNESLPIEHPVVTANVISVDSTSLTILPTEGGVCVTKVRVMIIVLILSIMFIVIILVRMMYLI